MSKVKNAGQFFDFLNRIYGEGNVPSFDQLIISELDKNIFDVKGEEEITMMNDGECQINYAKYYMYFGLMGFGGYGGCVCIPFDYKQDTYRENGELIWQKPAPTLREQLVYNKISESSLIIVVLDERSEIIREGSVNRSLTIFFSDKTSGSWADFDFQINEIDEMVNNLGSQIDELKWVKSNIESLKNVLVMA